jgi:nitroreductase
MEGTTKFTCFLDLVNARFSCRSFLETPVEREKIERCLEAARLAPSACNSQPWKFLVVDDPEKKNELCDHIFTGVYKTNLFARKAPAIVVVISEKGTFLSRVGGLVRDTRYYLIDIGIAVEHFVLQAAELGLGTCWMGWFNEKAAKRVLNLPRSTKIDIVLPLGYPAKEPHETKRKPLNEMSSFWSQ